MYKPGSAITRKQSKLSVWVAGGFIIEGFAHLPEGSRESDYFEASVKSTLAMTKCSIKCPDGSEHLADTVIVNKEQVLFFQPLE